MIMKILVKKKDKNSFFLFLSTSAEILSVCVTRELREPEPGGGGRLAAIGSMYRWPAPIGVTG